MNKERMTSTVPAASSSVAAQESHPSPHRDRVGPWAMWFGILGAPAAWSLQQLVNAPLYAHGCFPKDIPLSQPIWPHAAGVALTVEVIAIVLCIAAGLMSVRNWRLTRGEKEGTGHHLMESGDGRSRFMSMVGMICSVMFLVAVGFATGLPLLVSPCNG